LVRTELVELPAKVVELLLLGPQAAGGRYGGLLFERAVHPLVDPLPSIQMPITAANAVDATAS
jgi:hypothetical protein